LSAITDLNMRQPEYFGSLDKLLQQHPESEWQTYLRWHLLHSSAPYLQAAVDQENFAFYGKVLSGQQQQEPRWQRGARLIDGEIGEALGQLFVEKHFPPAARVRMIELVANLKAVFRDRLAKLDWMTETTRAKALVKFDRFTQKIGHPEKFRDYSSVEIRPDDLLGNVRRANAFESRRELTRVGKPVDLTEWHMTPETVNAYFNPSQNEIVFPAGILQPPFFDLEMDDAVNYGAIGVVIGHEMTHGYDDQGRKYDADGNVLDTPAEPAGSDFKAKLKHTAYPTAEAAGIYLDYSKNRITSETLSLLLSLARESGLPKRIKAMFGGQKINITENRAVLHTALRNISNTPVKADGEDVMPEVNKVLAHVEKFSDALLTGAWKYFHIARSPKATAPVYVDIAHRAALGDDVGEAEALLDLALEARDLVAQGALAERLVGDQEQLLDLERLGDVVVGAELDRADRGLDRRERGDHDDVRRLG